jgi:hypothetical protein
MSGSQISTTGSALRAVLPKSPLRLLKGRWRRSQDQLNINRCPTAAPHPWRRRRCRDACCLESGRSPRRRNVQRPGRHRRADHAAALVAPSEVIVVLVILVVARWTVPPLLRALDDHLLVRRVREKISNPGAAGGGAPDPQRAAADDRRPAYCRVTGETARLEVGEPRRPVGCQKSGLGR